MAGTVALVPDPEDVAVMARRKLTQIGWARIARNGHPTFRPTIEGVIRKDEWRPVYIEEV